MTPAWDAASRSGPALPGSRIDANTYEDVVVIREWNPLEPDVVEDKYYAPGTGLLLELTVEGEDARVELIEYTPGG